MKLLLLVFTLSFLSLFFLAESSNEGLVKHFVGLRYKANVTRQEKIAILLRINELRYQCVNATTKKPYIVSLDLGLANSHEGLDLKMEHGFIVTFENIDDRDYYVGRPFHYPYDPVHDAFKDFILQYLDIGSSIGPGGYVFDFTVMDLSLN